MGFFRKFSDGLQNVVANLGTGRDKMSSSTYVNRLVDAAQLSTAYRNAWLPRKIVDIPAFDSCREWRLWNGTQQQIEAIEETEKKFNVKRKVQSAMIAARLYGGCGLFIGTGEPNPELPLDLERITKDGLKYLTLIPKTRLTGSELDLDPVSEWYGKPAYWNMVMKDSKTIRVHPSRIVPFIGSSIPDDDISYTDGWGDSVLTSVIESVLQNDSTNANIASLIFEAKIDVVQIPGLMDNLSSSGYEADLLKRFQLAATGKGINGMLILDKEEEHSHKTASFATLPDLMDRFAQNVSGAADIPMTRLFGTSPAGMNATGESDLRNYYDRLSAMQELELTPAMFRLDEVIIRSSLGSRPKEVHQEWAPLWQESEKSKAEIGKIIADTSKVLSDMLIYAPEALEKATTNALVEAGALPGIEAAVEEFGPPDAPTAEDIAAALVTQQNKTLGAGKLPKPAPAAKPPLKDELPIVKPPENIADSIQRMISAIPQPTFNIDVKTPDIKMEAPTFTFNPPDVNVGAPNITVNIPDFSPQPVNVTVQPAQVTAGDVKVDVHMPEPGIIDTTVEELDDKGRIKRTRAKPVKP
jgi:uncharacterized protein